MTETIMQSEEAIFTANVHTTGGREGGASTSTFVSHWMFLALAVTTPALGETRGFMKALIEPGTDRVLGFTAFCVEAGEVMPAVQVVMAAGLPYTAAARHGPGPPDDRRRAWRPVRRPAHRPGAASARIAAGTGSEKRGSAGNRNQ
jgi:hypothetical protein